MKPNKLENQFNKKLNEREIQPNENSWDRLNAMLTVAETNKTKKNFGWMYIAASFIGFVLVVTVFLSQTDDLIDVKKNPVVHENLHQEQFTVDSIKNNQTTDLPIVQKTEIVAIAKKIEPKRKVNTKNNLVQEQTQIVLANPIQTAIIQDTVEVSRQIASVEMTKSEPTVKVDAQKLLNQVDGELELTFREKVIYTVNKNYQSVKVALAKRNQE